MIALLAACNGGSDGGEGAASTTTEAPTTTAAETTTTTSAPDPFTVPDDPTDIDEAYVEAVLTELERINGDALRLAISEGLSPAVSDLLLSIYEPELGADQIDLLARSASEGFLSIRRPPGDVAVKVAVVHSGTVGCISVDASYDFSPVSENGETDLPLRVELRPQLAGHASNATPWVYFLRDALEGELPSPCAAP